MFHANEMNHGSCSALAKSQTVARDILGNRYANWLGIKGREADNGVIYCRLMRGNMSRELQTSLFPHQVSYFNVNEDKKSLGRYFSVIKSNDQRFHHCSA